MIALLDDNNNPSKFGELLQYMFAYETVVGPTRDLVYWSLNSSDSYRGAKWLATTQRDYWLEGEGQPYTKHNLVELCEWWLLHPVTRTGTLQPYLEWTIESDDISLHPISTALTTFASSKQAKVRRL